MITHSLLYAQLHLWIFPIIFVLTEIRGHTLQPVKDVRWPSLCPWSWKVKSSSLWFLELLLDQDYTRLLWNSPLLWGIHVLCTTLFLSSFQPIIVGLAPALPSSSLPLVWSSFWVTLASMSITLPMPWTLKWPRSLLSLPYILTHPLTATSYIHALPSPQTAQINGSSPDLCTSKVFHLLALVHPFCSVSKISRLLTHQLFSLSPWPSFIPESLISLTLPRALLSLSFACLLHHYRCSLYPAQGAECCQKKSLLVSLWPQLQFSLQCCLSDLQSFSNQLMFLLSSMAISNCSYSF